MEEGGGEVGVRVRVWSEMEAEGAEKWRENGGRGRDFGGKGRGRRWERRRRRGFWIEDDIFDEGKTKEPEYGVLGGAWP